MVVCLSVSVCVCVFLSPSCLTKQTALSGVDRAGLVDDVFALSRLPMVATTCISVSNCVTCWSYLKCCKSSSLSAGHLDITTAMELSQYLRKERDYVPWEAAFEWLYTFSGRLSLTGTYGKFEVQMFLP